MKTFWRVLALAAILTLACAAIWRQALIAAMPPSWRIAAMAWRKGVTVDHDVVIQMADGVRLHASLYRPRHAQGPLPTILVRVPYKRQIYGEAYNSGLFFAGEGYAVLVQDLRGTGDSEGELLPWAHAAEDGAATLDWIARQPWSTGKVGTFGCSALGETQLVLSKLNHPAHVAMIPSGAGGGVGAAAGRYSYFGLYEGGVFQLASGFGWFSWAGSKDPHALPAPAFDYVKTLRELPISALVKRVRPAPNGYSDFLAMSMADPRWGTQLGYLSDADHPAVPSLTINTWGDQTAGDALAYAEQQRLAGVKQKVVIAPGNHCQQEESATNDRFGELPVAHAAQPWRSWYLQWFDYWLRGKGDGLAALKPYTYFMLGEDNWLSADSWPPADATKVRWYLASEGHANSRKGDGRLELQAPAQAKTDIFRYDPASPVPSRGGPLCCTGDPDEKSGPTDQTDVEKRDDVLVYTSSPLADDLRVAGPLKAHLVFSSSALDTDLVLRLVDVWPDGRATSIQEGALRLRYREGMTKPKLLTPDQPVEATVDMRSIAYKLPRGHRLRLQVTSSSFPRLERNLNTGAPNNADETRMVVAVNHIHHGAGAQSYLELPILPAIAK
jgi:hypothetical protein